jgi:hypothetical protein
VRSLRRRTDLWQEKGGQEEAMRAQFHHPYLAVRVDAGYSQFAVVKQFLIARIEPIVAGELLRHFCLAIDPVGQRSWPQRDCLCRPHQRTGQSTDDRCGSRGSRFLMLGLDDSQDMACILYQSMLKPSSGADERPSLLAGKPDRL